ncbi:MAG: MBL fold metallo-hydrolase [Pleurocapsa minor GSE-CHR-MK-17-07R]|jgi:glyoxylase-like metal-dependent hydrolase (beta-lactamase superfamily II)|nr:MBL fold metallo-hydrolase [Pleurocapsa minor GSE-CHR-MK 17-07R]
MNLQQAAFSRRNFLKGAGAAAFATSFSTWFALRPVMAQDGTPASGVTAFARFNVGALQVTVIQDAVFPLETSILGANATVDDINAVLAANNQPVTGAVNATVNPVLVNTGSELILIDSGNGADAGGSLNNTLALLGVTPDSINRVVISHFHPDHINGLLAGGAAAFPNATIHFPQAEWDFMQATPADSPAAGLVTAATAALQPYLDADQVSYYAPEGEILPGIVAVPAPGHTPGHTAIRLESEGESVLNLIDTALSAVISLSRPDWYAAFDAVPELAAETRLALLTSAAADGARVMGYHFPFPGVGYVVAEDDAFSFVPAT